MSGKDWTVAGLSAVVIVAATVAVGFLMRLALGF